MCTGVKMGQVSYSFNRPSDTNNYADNDLVANSVTAGSVVPLSFAIPVGNGRGIEITGATLQKSGVSVTGATFELLLFTASPTTGKGDNEAFSFADITTSGYLGLVAFPAMSAFSDDARAVINVGDQTGGMNPIRAVLSGSSVIYGLLMTAAAYTDEASAETFTATITFKQYPVD